jgi:dTDP-4-dehydrorhamnose 3,5-epimerase
MIFTETKISGAFIIEPEKLEDNRGYFLRSFCKKEFEAHGLQSNFVQFNISLSKNVGTLRGMHYQIAPHQETKLIRCTKGVLYEVIIDLRPKSHSYMQWFGVELNAEMYKMLYIPAGLASGFLTLKDDTEVFYPATQFYCAESERGIRWDDPCFDIEWPKTGALTISGKDKNWPDFSP